MNRNARTILILHAGIMVLAIAVHPSDAAAVGGGVGIDYVSGPGNHNTQDALGYISTPLRGGDVTLIGARYDNSDVGGGTLGSVGEDAVRGPTLLRISCGRTIGDQSYWAWRLRPGRSSTSEADARWESSISTWRTTRRCSNGVVTELVSRFEARRWAGSGVASSEEGGPALRARQA
jgi:hypothetical protein